MVAGEWIAPMNNEENTANIAQGASRISTPTDTTHPLRKRNSWAILRGASSIHIWTAARIAFDTVSPPFAITIPSRHKHTPRMPNEFGPPHDTQIPCSRVSCRP